MPSASSPLLPLLLLALSLQLLPPAAEAAVVGFSTDIEECEVSTPGGCDGLIDALVNASRLLKANNDLGIRLSTDVAVGWSTANYTYGEPAGVQRPVLELIMDVVDEVVLMDYSEGCHEPLWTAAMPCYIGYAMFWTAPFITYSQFLKHATDREVLVTVGLGIDATPQNWASQRFHTELQLETFIAQAQTLMHGCGLGRNAHCDAAYGWRAAGPFHRLASITVS